MKKQKGKSEEEEAEEDEEVQKGGEEEEQEEEQEVYLNYHKYHYKNSTVKTALNISGKQLTPAYCQGKSVQAFLSF